MSAQLDILALEPFYGTARRAMLETVIRCSRHRWTLLKLPPRRMERRLTAAASWFGEQLSRHWSGKVDLLFTSEAMNLADLYRILPALARQPSVVYFHDNQLPLRGVDGGRLELVNLNTATAATEIWFNSLFHLRSFLERASSLVERHSELSSRNPMSQLTAKACLMPSPMDLGAAQLPPHAGPIRRDPSTLFVETRGADMDLLNSALDRLHTRGEEFKLITIGPVEDLSDDWQRRTVAEMDETAQLAALAESGTFLSVKPDAVFDYQAIRGMLAGCQPVFPESGCYPEILPDVFPRNHLYQVDPNALAHRLFLSITSPNSVASASAIRQSFKAYEALAACRAFDERLEELVKSSMKPHPAEPR